MLQMFGGVPQGLALGSLTFLFQTEQEITHFLNICETWFMRAQNSMFIDQQSETKNIEFII